MSEILTEPSSQRADNKIWVWRYGDAVNTPFKVNFYNKDTGEKYFDIPTSMYVRFLIKDDLRDETPIIEKVYKFIAPNIFVVELSTEEVVQLRAGKTYHVGVALYGENDNFVRALISDLPLRVDKSALNKSVF